MGVSNSERQSMRYFGLNQKCDETNNPHFTEKVKVGDMYESKGQYNEFSGRLVSGKIHVGKTKAGMEIRSFRLIFEDKDGRYQLEMAHGGLTYNILNCLAFPFDTRREVKIVVYKKEEKRGPINYHNSRSWLTIAPHTKEDALKWRYSLDEIPKKEEIKLADGTSLIQNGKKVLDDKKLRAFWEKIAETEIFARLNEEGSAPDFEVFSDGSLPKETMQHNPLPESPNKGSKNPSINDMPWDMPEGDLPF